MRAEVYTSRDPGFRAHKLNKLVAYLNFDGGIGDEVAKRMQITKKSGACGDSAIIRDGGTVLLDESKIQVGQPMYSINGFTHSILHQSLP